MEQNKNWIKNCLGYTTNKYTTAHGNGKCEPQYKLDTNTGKMTKLLKKDGTPKTYNRYLEIQAAKASTDYKKLIENTNFDLEAVNFILNSNNPKYEYEKAIDYTNFGGIETLKSMENKIVNTFGSLEKFNQYCKTKMNKSIEQYKTQIKAHKEKLQEIKSKKNKEYSDFLAWKKANGGTK